MTGNLLPFQIFHLSIFFWKTLKDWQKCAKKYIFFICLQYLGNKKCYARSPDVKTTGLLVPFQIFNLCWKTLKNWQKCAKNYILFLFVCNTSETKSAKSTRFSKDFKQSFKKWYNLCFFWWYPISVKDKLKQAQRGTNKKLGLGDTSTC